MSEVEVFPSIIFYLFFFKLVFCLRLSFSLNSQLAHGFGQTVWAANPNNPPVSTSSVLGLQVCTTTPGISLETGAPNSGFHVFTESI